MHVNKTCYKELGYAQCDKGLWRIVDLTDGEMQCIGPHYKTKAELLANLDRYAGQFGCKAAPEQTSLQTLQTLLDMANEALSSVLHQLGTDSDLDDKVSAPEKYDSLTELVRKTLAKTDPTNPQLRYEDFSEWYMSELSDEP